MAIQIQLRRDTAANWTSSNPVLAQGEIGVETNTGKIKVGNGSTAWNSLSYYNADISATAPLDYTNGTLSFTKTVPTGDIVGTTDTQTLTNKTLTAPRITTASNIADANGNELIVFPSAVASAVNEITVSNAAASGTPSITASGGDTNISLNLASKGTGTVQANGVAVVTTSGTQTLTNKTLTSPTVNTPAITLSTTTSTTAGRLAYTSNTLRMGNGSTTLIFSDDASINIAQSQVTNLTTDLAAKAPLASPTFTGTVTLPSTTSVGNVSSTELGYLDGVTSAIQTQLDAKAPLTQTVDNKTAAYTTVAGDNGKVIRLTGSTAVTFTIANVLSIGQRIDFLQDGTGQITFAAGSGVTLRSVDNKLKMNKQYSGATVICVASGVYHLIGDLAA